MNCENMWLHFNLSIIYLFLTINVKCLNCARILGVIPIASYSHQNFYRPIWRELSKRGHELVILTTNPMRDPALINVTEIDLSKSFIYNSKILKDLRENPKEETIKVAMKMAKVVRETLNYQLEHPDVQNLIKNETEHFDLLIVEYLLPRMFAFAARFRCPFIGVLSMDIQTWGHLLLGNPVHPLLYPEIELPFRKPKNLYERCISVLGYICKRILTKVAKNENRLAKKYFGENVPSITAIAANVSLVLINSNPFLSLHRPLTPATIEIGGGFHMEPPQELPNDLQSFLESSERGVVYFSLGSNIKKGNGLISEQIEMFLKSFAKLPYNVLWVLDENVEDPPKNVKISKWVPQQDILRHSSVKVFVTQGGIQSIDESIICGVPMVVIPLVFDQFYNADMIVEKQIGVILDIESLNEDIFVKAVNEVIRNPLYKAKVTMLAKFILDQPMTGLEKAIWWIEYTIRHKGEFNLKGNVNEFPLYQYYLLDVISCAFILLALVTLFIYVIIKRVFRTRNKVKVS